MRQDTVEVAATLPTIKIKPKTMQMLPATKLQPKLKANGLSNIEDCPTRNFIRKHTHAHITKLILQTKNDDANA